MCGIAVAIDWPGAEAVVASLIERILHRGDVTDPITAIGQRTAMATRRLRIVDAAHAVQPQLSCDGRYAVCFNGELYNHAALRAELGGLGLRFRTESDTEVLANALQAWGPQAVERFAGMYAFVAIDLQSGAFLAGRDPFGIKPLYLIAGEHGGLCFCSEIRPLTDVVETGDVLLVPPGHLLTATSCTPFVPRLPQQSEAPAPATLDRLLAQAVEVRLPPGLPVATMFSGGIDSTLLAHYVRRFRPEAPGYFVGDAAAPDYPYAAAYAEQSGLDLRLVPIDGLASFAAIDRVVDFVESFEPNLVRAAACSLAVSERMQQDGFRVALCGEGADELFCGYPPLEVAFLAEGDAARPFRDQVLGLMHRVSLQRVDRCAMHHGIETRQPFLDPAIAAYALGLDAGTLVRQAGDLPVGKAPLRDLYDLYPDALPRAIRDRTKMPFGAGAGLDARPEEFMWAERFEEAFTDLDLWDGQREFDGFRVQSKEELYYLRRLAHTLDVFRVPHLRARAWLSFPVERYQDALRKFPHYAL
jgi:asparagine synthase (glutamine-hydrolysing)